MAGSRAAIEGWRRRPLDPAARSVVMFSGAVLFLKLLALLHPSKLLIDALFHAHRLEWVMAGRYYFTQPMPSGVQFPYAIALYVFAAPWAAFTRDHVALLRIVVAVCQAVAGATLYPMVARNWHDRRAAVIAVMLFHTVPLPYPDHRQREPDPRVRAVGGADDRGGGNRVDAGKRGSPPAGGTGVAGISRVPRSRRRFPDSVVDPRVVRVVVPMGGRRSPVEGGSAVLLATTIAVGVSVALLWPFRGHLSNAGDRPWRTRAGAAPRHVVARLGQPAPDQGPGPWRVEHSPNVSRASSASG